jgi:hypothetical protein
LGGAFASPFLVFGGRNVAMKLKRQPVVRNQKKKRSNLFSPVFERVSTSAKFTPMVWTSTLNSLIQCRNHENLFVEEWSLSVAETIHALRDVLEAARLQLVEELATKGDLLPTDLLQRIALLQSALTAVRQEIEAHTARIGGGSEQPLE